MAIKSYAINTSGVDLFPGAVLESGEYAITNIMFCNISGADTTLNVYAVPSGKTVGNVETQVIKSLLVPAGETFTFDTEKFVLIETDRIHATAAANNALVATISYMQVS